MAKPGYNSYAVVECKSGRNVLVTQSARKAAEALEKGRRIEVWNSGVLEERLYYWDTLAVNLLIAIERDYIAEKQRRHEERNARRR